MDKCKICNKNSEETHHIKEQELADETNHIEHFHKNNEHNLVPLCKQCHLEVTHGNLIIEGYIDTSIGKQLKYNYSNKPKNKKKYTDEIDTILKYKEHYNNSKSKCKKLLQINEDINISLPTLSSIMHGDY